RRSEIVFGSDDWLAEKLVTEFGDDWRYAGGDWLRWDGRRWEPEKTKLAWDISRRVSRTQAGSISDQSLATRISSASAIYAGVRLAEADRRVAVVRAAFDADHWLLNTPDGIVDLRTGDIGPHRREALMSKIAAAGPTGQCPIFLRYLEEVTGGDKELQRYLQ